jgi:uncharacterized membrane protein (UPF0182 family)
LKTSDKIKLIAIAVVVFFLLSLGSLIFFYTDWLWFQEVGFTQVFWLSIWAKIITAAVFGLIFFIILYGNILIARRFAPKYLTYEDEVVKIYKSFPKRLLSVLLIGGAILFSLVAAASAADKWLDFLKYFNQASFNLTDPIFHNEVAFYVFSLPIYTFIYGWLLGSLAITGIVVALVHFFDGGIQIRRGEQILAPHVKAHLSVIAGLIFLVVAWGFRLNMFELLYSPRGAAFGASYADVHAQLPAYWILLFTACATALLFLVNIYFKGWKLPVAGISILIVAGVIAAGVYPAIIQQYRVSPNEIEKEAPYIKRNINYTRMAYNLDKVKEQEFPANESLTLDGVKRNEATIRNVRLWDWRPLMKTYGQIQSIRLYYNFNDVDVDRYNFDGDYREVTLSGRELNQQQLPESAKTWVNEHLVYTHGYGFVMNPVNIIAGDGLPDLLVKDIPPISKVDLPIKRPEIYYGEIGNQYVIVKTKTKEFDYPKGDKNQYTFYEGSGGVPIDSYFKKALFSWRFASLKLLVSDAIAKNSRIMYYRNIQDRVAKVAPFLRLDQDPYLVVSSGRLFWIQDAYTTTDMYPYSEPFENNQNYIRNSAKVVIDAYTGKMTFYVIDKTDPLLRSYSKIFPDLFVSFDKLSPDLESHLRYPQDLFEIQTRMYAAYHMQDPQVFYNKEDLWNIPKEILEGSETSVQPYYIIMKLPGFKDKEEFIIMMPFTPTNKDNMISWMCARCDSPNYGKLLVYKFPKQKLVFGPVQVEARIDQDPTISEQFTLWSQSGSSVIRGNLLAIPIEESLLFIEPVYLQAERTELPELKRVVVAFGNKIAMEQSLEAAIEKVFTGQVTEPQAEKSKETPKTETSIANLIKEAGGHFDKAQEHLKAGDFAAYGEEMDLLQKTLAELKSRTEKQ